MISNRAMGCCLVALLLGGVFSAGCGKPACQTPPVSDGDVASPWLEHLEDLIERLAISQEEAKFPSELGESATQSPVLPPEETAETEAEQRARIDAAHAAVWEIRACGRAAWGRLLEQVGDRRKSVCLRSALPCTVGGACYNIVEDQVIPQLGGYAGRTTIPRADHNGYVRPVKNLDELYGTDGLAGWLKAREGRTLTEIHIEVIEWLIAEEMKIGFPPEADKETYLYPLECVLAELQAKKKAEQSDRWFRDVFDPTQ